MSYTPSISSRQVNGVDLVYLEKRNALGEVEQSIEFCPDQLSSADQLTFYRCLWQKVNTDQAEFDSILRSTIAEHPQAAPAPRFNLFCSLGTCLCDFISMIWDKISAFFASCCKS